MASRATESAVQNTNHTVTCCRPMRMRLFVVGTCCLAIGALVGWNARAQARLPAHEHSHRSAPLHDTAGVVVVEADRSSILWPLGRVRDGSAQDAHHLRHVTTENHQGEAAHGLRPGKPADQAHSQVHSSSNNHALQLDDSSLRKTRASNTNSMPSCSVVAIESDGELVGRRGRPTWNRCSAQPTRSDLSASSLSSVSSAPQWSAAGRDAWHSIFRLR